MYVILALASAEDSHFEVYPTIQRPFGSLVVATESVDGLYHRKLRTVSGRVSEGSEVEGGRQTARDLFDLYVLSKAVKPIREFIATVPYAFPSDAFDNGLSSMRWMELADELEHIRCAPEWAAAKDIGVLQDALLAEIGAMALDEFPQEGEGEESEQQPGRLERGDRRR